MAQNAFGPVLTGWSAGKAGSYPGYDYSQGLQESNVKGLIWTEDLLTQWLHGPFNPVRLYLGNPKAHSKMPMMVEDAEARRDVVAYLGTLAHESSNMDTAGHDLSMVNMTL